MSDKKNPEKIKMFISYKTEDNRSEEIREQLEVFFGDWGIECKAIDKEETADTIDSTIHKELGKPHYLIQIISEQEEPSEWMAKELNLANTLYKTGKMHKPPIVFYTAETPIDNQHYKRYFSELPEGSRIINIDKSNPVPTLQGILIDAGVLNKKHGKIVLPSFCQPSIDPTEISLQSLEDFIENFRHAHKRGLSRIHTKKEKPTKWLVDRLKKMKEGETVRMIGFTLNRYVYPKNEKGIGDVFAKEIARCNGTAQLLIINRDSKAAHERMKIETPVEYKKDHKTSLLYKDNQDVEEYYLSTKWKGKVDIKKYEAPYIGMVIFNDMILVEIYHLGDDGEEKLDKNICGRVPVLVIREGTPFYKLFYSHFIQVWENTGDVT